jgi:predicted ATPase
MDRLIVKNFGPLKDVDIELNKINLFIGENGSGKSVLAKLVTIFTDKNNWKNNEILIKIEEFDISFITEETFIKLNINDDVNRSISLENKKIVFGDLFQELNQVIKQNELNKQKIDALVNQIKELPIEMKQTIEFAMIDYMRVNKKLSSQYIPAERSFLSFISKSLSSFIVSDIPLAKFFLRFSSEFEKAGNELKELEFLNVKYINGDGLDRHKIYFNNKDYLPLAQSSSGIQSALPLYLTVKYFSEKYGSIIIEEPEQNLFPKAQTETIKYIIEQISEENSLLIMTHSPYVLSTFNNLIFSHKVAQMSEKTKEQVKEFIKEEQWINPDNFSAYYLENGVARSIKSSRGMISDNEIDDISDEMGDEFDTLMEIYREFKYAK